jgi:nucleoside-diphosphate-sugar epimerase
MRTLVIGGTGFVGPHIVRRLVELGHEVLVFHRGETEADLPREVAHLHGERERLEQHRAELARFDPGVVVDTRPMTDVEARNLMNSMAGIARRVVALSSGDVYRAYGLIHGTETGPPEPIPIAEGAPLRQRLYPYRGATPRAPDDPMRWIDDYDKILVERAVMGEPTLPGTVLRLPMIYGPGDRSHRLFSYLKRMDDGRPAILLEETHSRWLWARGYVEDIARAVASAAHDDRAAGLVYNVSEPDPLTEAAWVRAIAQEVGWRGNVVTVPAKRLPQGLRAMGNFEQHLTYDTARVRAELGYSETVPRPEAIRRTVAWERSHPPDRFEVDYAAEDAVLAGLAREGNLTRAEGA